MENNILREIIDVEKEIQQSLDQAKISTREWLDSRKKEIEDDTASQEKEIALSFQQAREKAAQDAEKKASELLEEAKKRTDRITHIENVILARIVTSQIKKILPG